MTVDALVELNHKAVEHASEGKLSVAYPQFQESIDGLEALKGSTHFTTVKALAAFAKAAIANEQYDEVEARMLKSLQDHETTLGQGSVKTLQLIALIGQLYKHQGRLGDAETYLKQAKEGLQTSASEPEDRFLQTRTIAEDLIEIAIEQQNFEEAETVLLESIKMAESLGSTYHETVLHLKHKLAHLYGNKTWEARELTIFQKAPPIRKAELLLLELAECSKFGADGLNVDDADICPWRSLLLQYYDRNDQEKLEAFLTRTISRLQFYATIPPRAKEEILAMQIHIARSFWRLRKQDDADQWFLRAQQNIDEDSSYGPESAYSFENGLYHAHMLLESDEWNRAKENFLVVKEKALKLYGPQSHIYDTIEYALKTRQWVPRCSSCTLT